MQMLAARVYKWDRFERALDMNMIAFPCFFLLNDSLSSSSPQSFCRNGSQIRTDRALSSFGVFQTPEIGGLSFWSWPPLLRGGKETPKGKPHILGVRDKDTTALRDIWARSCMLLKRWNSCWPFFLDFRTRFSFRILASNEWMA